MLVNLAGEQVRTKMQEHKASKNLLSAPNNFTALLKNAIKEDDLATFKELVSYLPFIDVHIYKMEYHYSFDIGTPLCLSIKYKAHSIFSYLINDLGANFQFIHGKSFPIHVAAYFGNLHAFKFLLDNGVDFEQPNCSGETRTCLFF